MVTDAFHNVLVPVRIELIFEVAMRWHGQDREVIPYHFSSLLEAGERDSRFPGEGVSSGQENMAGELSGIVSCWGLPM